PTRTTVETDSSTGGSYQKDIQNTFGFADSLQEKMGKVTNSVVTTQQLDRANSTIVHTTAFDYEPVNTFFPQYEGQARTTLGLTKKTLEPNGGAPIELDTAYAYDRFGNVTTTTECAGDVGCRATTVSYDPADFNHPSGNGLITTLTYRAGRFPVKTTNALGQSEFSAYDPLKGVLVQRTGPNGIHTCRGYDAFGRQISETNRC